MPTEGKPDTTTSAPAIVTEKTNGENTQKKENLGEDKVQVGEPGSRGE
jgi:hypothetical protein